MTCILLLSTPSLLSQIPLKLTVNFDVVGYFSIGFENVSFNLTSLINIKACS